MSPDVGQSPGEGFRAEPHRFRRPSLHLPPSLESMLESFASRGNGPLELSNDRYACFSTCRIVSVMTVLL